MAIHTEGLRNIALMLAVSIAVYGCSENKSAPAGDAGKPETGIVAAANSGPQVNDPATSTSQLTNDVRFAYVQRSIQDSATATVAKYEDLLTRADSAPLNLSSPYDVHPGAKLYVRSSLDVDAIDEDLLTAYFGSTDYDVKDINVSADGSKLVFAAHGSADDPRNATWNIFEYQFANGTLRRIIADDDLANAGQDTSPTYTLSGDIVFSSDRNAGNPASPVTNIVEPDSDCVKITPNEQPSLLHSMDRFGDNILQLTYGNNHDTKTTTLKDGRVAFVRWSRSYELVPNCTVGPMADYDSLFDASYPAGLATPAGWSADAQCAYAFDSEVGPVIPSNHYTVLRITADGSELEQLYDTVTVTASDEEFLGLSELVQGENGKLVGLLKHEYNPFAGGALVELQSPANPATGSVFTGANLRSLTPKTPDLYPSQLSGNGWYSALWPYRDGSKRYLLSWSNCYVNNNGISAFCSSGKSGEAESRFGIWVYDPATDTRLPVVRARADVVYSELAMAQPHTGVEFPFAPFNPEFVDNMDASRIVCPDPGVVEEPEVPVVPEEPEAPVVPEEPEVPVVPEEPEVPVVPEEPEVPVVPEEPEVPVVPEEPEVPVVPEEPEVPVVPEEPEVPVVPEEPEVPVVPEEPEVPVVPEEPEVPVVPEEPEVPVVPEEPEVPVVPEEPEVPVVPEEPEVPVVPEEPEVPVEPQEPEVPVVPEEPEVPVVPEEPEVPVVPEEPEVPVVPEEPEVPVVPDNTPPVANAGADRAVELTNSVMLDGSASIDADGDTLTYQWTVLASADGATATLSDATAMNPTLAFEGYGDYVIELVVFDGEDYSAPDSVLITANNTPPVANAGADRPVALTNSVMLDGSASTDADGDALTYHWTVLSTADGATAALSEATAVKPTLTFDGYGDYVIELVVFDGEDYSAPDTVLVTSNNTPPVAAAGDDRWVTLSEVVLMDASASSDADGDALSYYWTLVALPEGSSASLDDATEVTPMFTVDLAGSYVLELVVNDGLADSAADQVVITTLNTKPVADAGDDMTALVGDSVSFDGSGSYDPDGDAITYAWSLTSKPEGSMATLSAAGSTAPSLQADAVGTYVAQLIVNDGTLASTPDTVSLEVAQDPAVCDTSSITKRAMPFTLRDFKSSHPDFEYRIAEDFGIVKDTLGADGKPVYAKNWGSTETTNGKDAFNQWYNTVEGVNKEIPMEFVLERNPVTGYWGYDNEEFFPLDDHPLAWGKTPGWDHNYHFTLETHLTFKYEGGEVFTFRGDDDLFLFINNKLVIDIGGVHAVIEQTVSLDELADELGIEPGNTYRFDLFFAERHTVESNFKFDTNIELQCSADE